MYTSEAECDNRYIDNGHKSNERKEKKKIIFPHFRVIYPEEFLNDMASIEAQKKTNDGESTSKQKTEQKAAVSTQKTKWRTKKDESGSDEEYPNPPLTESVTRLFFSLDPFWYIIFHLFCNLRIFFTSYFLWVKVVKTWNFDLF